MNTKLSRSGQLLELDPAGVAEEKKEEEEERRPRASKQQRVTERAAETVETLLKYALMKKFIVPLHQPGQLTGTKICYQHRDDNFPLTIVRC